jgi:hypothetical protein
MINKKSSSRFEFVINAFKLSNSKRSQIGTTLTWFFGFIIIFVIMVIFITSTSVLAVKKTVNSKDLSIEGFNVENLRVERNLINFLNSPVEIDGKIQKTSSVLLSSLDSYLEDESGIYFASWKLADKSVLKKLNGDINNLGNIRESLSEEFFASSNARIKDEIIFNRTKSSLGNFCSEYMLIIPQGVVMKDLENFASVRNYEGSSWKEFFIGKWTEPIEIIFPYKNQIVKIKYRELKEC